MKEKEVKEKMLKKRYYAFYFVWIDKINKEKVNGRNILSLYMFGLEAERENESKGTNHTFSC